MWFAGTVFVDFFFLAVIFFIASAAIGRFYIGVGNLFLFASWQEDFFFQLAASVVFRCCVLGVVLFRNFAVLTSFLFIVYCFDYHPVFGGLCFHTFLILLPCFSFFVLTILYP